MKIQLKRSNVLTGGFAKEPTAAQLEYGELAVNYNTDDPAIFLKDSNNNVIRISGIGNIADDGQVELPASNTPPLNPQPGNLWYNSEDGRLYIYYKDPDTEQWVDASPDSWDPSSYPDVSDDDAQAGTLDDRYLMLNADNSPVTGTCEFAGGVKVTGGDATSVDTGMFLSGDKPAIAKDGIEAAVFNPQGNGQFTVASRTRDKTLVGLQGISCTWNSANHGNQAIDLFYGPITVDTNTSGTVNGVRIVPGTTQTGTGQFVGYRSVINNADVPNGEPYNFYAAGDAPNYFAGNVGIGTSTPILAPLHVKQGSNVSVLNLSAGTGADSNSQILFTNSAGNSGFTAIEAKPESTNGYLNFITGGSDSMTIDAQGNVGIGTTNPDSQLTSHGGSLRDAENVFSSKVCATLRVARGGGNDASVNQDSGTGAILEFRHDTNRYVSVESRSESKQSTKIGLKFTTMPTTGTTTEAMRLTGGGNLLITNPGCGIFLNGESDPANNLNDYEEGNWSPQLQTTNNDITADYTKNTGTYVKIGQLVYLQATIKLNTLTGGTGSVRIINLPFTTVDGVDKRSAFSIGYALNFPAQVPVSGLVGSNSTSISVYRQVADAGYIKQLQAMPISDWDGNSEVRFSGMYTAS